MKHLYVVSQDEPLWCCNGIDRLHHVGSLYPSVVLALSVSTNHTVVQLLCPPPKQSKTASSAAWKYNDRRSLKHETPSPF